MRPQRLVVGTLPRRIFHRVWLDLEPKFLGRFISCDLCISEVKSLKLLDWFYKYSDITSVLVVST